jgi:hypothetical protein
MTSNVTIAYLADVTDLRTKNALAKAALAETSAAAREQAAAFAELTEEQKGPALAALQAVTAEQSKLKAVVAELTAEQKKAAAEAEHSTGAFSKLHENVRLTGESFESLSASLRVWTNAAGAIGEFALVGLGIKDTLEAFSKAAEAAEGMAKLSAATGIATDQLYAMKEVALQTATPWETVESDLTRLARAMTEAADSATSGPARAFAAMGVAVLDATGHMRPMTTIIDELAAKFATYGAGTGKAALELQLFGRTATDLNTFLNELGREGMQAATDAAKQQGDYLGGPAVQAAQEYEEHIKQLTIDWHSFANTIFTVVLPAMNAVGKTMGANLDEQIASLKSKIADMKAGFADGVAGIFPQMDGHDAGLGGDVLGLDTLQKQLAALEAQKAQLDKDTSGRNQSVFGSQNAPAQGSAQAPAFDKEGGTQVEQWKTQLLQMQSADGQFHAISAAQEAAFWQSKIALTKAGSTEQREVLEQFEEASRRAQSEGTRAAKKTAEEEFEAYKGGIDRQLAAARDNYPLKISLLEQEVAEAKRLFGEKSKAAIEAETEIAEVQARQQEAAIKGLEAQLEATRNVQKAMADIDAAGSKSNVGEFKASFGLVFDDSALQAQVQAQVAKLRAALDDQLAGLQSEIQGRLDIAKSLEPGSDAFNEQMKTVTADFAAMAAANKEFTDQAVSLNERAAQAVDQAWSSITNPIASGFSKVLDAALSGHQNIVRSAESAAASIVSTWAKAAITQLAHWLMSELGMTSATAAGAATRAALGNSSETQQLQQIATLLQKYLAGEQAKTLATITSAATQTATKTAAAGAGQAADAAASGKTIMGDAAKAFSGTYAALAGIPLIGPFIAPVAAAGAFAAVAAYETLASAEGGQERVPRNGQMTVLHKDEMVLPAHVADSVRSMANSAPRLASAGSGGSGNSSVVNSTGDTSHNISVHYAPTIHAPGVAASSADLADALRSSHQELNTYMRNTYVNGGLNLPGRSPWQ